MTDVDKLKCPSKGKIPLSPFSPPAHSFALLRFSDRSVEKERGKDGWKIEKRLGRDGRGGEKERSGGVALRPRPLPPARENAKRCMYRAAIARREGGGGGGQRDTRGGKRGIESRS